MPGGVGGGSCEASPYPDLQEGKAFCFMSGPNEEAIWQAHAAVQLPYDSITEVKRVTGADLRLPQSTEVQPRNA